MNVSDWNIRSSQTGKTLAGVGIQHVTEIPFEAKEKTDEEKGPVRFITLTSPKKAVSTLSTTGAAAKSGRLSQTVEI